MTARFLFWTVILIFLTQNCDQTNMDQASSEAGVAASGVMGTVDLDRPVVFRMQQQSVEMDLQQGEILQADDAGWVGFCLQEDKLDSILLSLSEFSVCKTKHDYPDDILCTMEYRFPYIEVYVGEDAERTPLGQENSGCPEQTIDLCETGAKDLEELLRDLRFDRDFSSCN